MLSTLFLFKTAMGITQSDDDDQFVALLGAASDAIVRHCDRTFALTTYREWLDGSGERFMLLRNWPITAIYGVATGFQQALQVKHATATYANVSAEDTGIRLFSVDTTGAQTESTIAYSSYATIGSLAAQIDSLGWSTSILSGMSSQPSTLIRPIASVWAVSPSYAELQIPYMSRNVRLNPDSDRMIERLDWGFDLDLTAAGTRNPMIFPLGHSNVFAWYKAGYTEPVDDNSHSNLSVAGNVPAELTFICNNIAKALYDASDDVIGSSQSQRTGDVSWSIAEGGRAIIAKILNEYASVLTRYRRLA